MDLNFIQVNQNMALLLSENIYADIDKFINTNSGPNDLINPDEWERVCLQFGFYFGTYALHRNQSLGEHSSLWQGMNNIDSRVATFNDPSFERLHTFIYPGMSLHSIGQYAFGLRNFISDNTMPKAMLGDVIHHLECSIELLEDFYEDEETPKDIFDSVNACSIALHRVVNFRDNGGN